MTLVTIRDYITSLLPENTIVATGTVYKPPSVSVYSGPETRSARASFIGGAECNDYKKYPINIVLKTSMQYTEAENTAKVLYDTLKDKNNFSMGSENVAFISALDDLPIYLGHSSENYIEFLIRIDIYYYDLNL